MTGVYSAKAVKLKGPKNPITPPKQALNIIKNVMSFWKAELNPNININIDPILIGNFLPTLSAIYPTINDPISPPINGTEISYSL